MKYINLNNKSIRNYGGGISSTVEPTPITPPQD